MKFIERPQVKKNQQQPNVFCSIKNNQLCSENNSVVTWGCKLFSHEQNLQRALIKVGVCGML